MTGKTILECKNLQAINHKGLGIEAISSEIREV
jgi:hypothetical protein